MATRADLQSTAGGRGEDRGEAARDDRAGERGAAQAALTDCALAEFAPAKVNLFLHVTGRRPDGYHLLDSLVVFAGVGDTLRAERGAAVSLTIDGPFASGLSAGDDNLVVRAVRRAGANGVAYGAALRLTKVLPVASGIGGGSADAAAALRVMRRLWGLDQDFAAVALSLGADVPVCLASRPARMRGIGERLEPAPRLPPCGIVLVNPGMAVATADVFRARTRSFSAEASLPAGWSDVRALVQDLRACRNDLEAPAIGVCPAIGSVLRVLADVPGCLLARMSGSGATCFGLFASEEAAVAGAAAIPRPGWWCWGGGLHEAG